VLARADRALYRSKESGRGRFHFHTAELDREAREHVALANDLRAAIRDERLELYYQAQVELSSGRMTGMEALVRWAHPRLGLLLPHAFLPIAERNGLMRALGGWVLDRACRQLREWRDGGVAVPLIAVNLGLAHVRAGSELVADVKRSLARWRLEPQDLELDVTESILARTTLARNPVLEELHELGVHIAIDDFGSQYSTLDYLRTYRVSRLKIAKPIVSAAVAEEPAATLVRAIMSLASELGVEVIAEGVETETQRRQLLELNARAKGQGFYFGRPAPAQTALQQLRAPANENRPAGGAQDAEDAASGGPSNMPQRMRKSLPPEDS
jgi:EAL domain-containing protein (putative c-di-GMP-specific phosphodiesterase class I)